MTACIALAVVALAAQEPTDSMYRAALERSDAELVVQAKVAPFLVRDAIADAMARSVRPAKPRTEALQVARRWAVAYAAGWRDSFLVRQVERFIAAPPASRVAKIRADSLRRAGVAAFTRDGPAAAIAIWRRALRTYRDLADTAAMASSLDNIAAGLLQLGRADSAERALRRARSLSVVAGDVRLQANVLGRLADLSADRGDFETAGRRYAEARRLRERVGDTRGMAADHNNLGLMARQLGDLDEARRQFEAALALNRREGRPEAAATNLVNLAALASLEGDLARAGEMYRDALATWRARGDSAEAAAALVGLGHLEQRRGDYPAARSVLVDALAIYERTGSDLEALDVRRALATVLAAAGDPQAAMDQLEEVDRLAVRAEAPPAVRGAVAIAHADLAVRLNRLEAAERRYRDADRWFARARDPSGQADARHGLGVIALARDDTVRAGVLLAAALRQQRASGDVRAALVTSLALARLEWQRGDTMAARRALADIAGRLARAGDSVAAAEALGERGALEAEAGNGRAAESLYGRALRLLDRRIAPETAWKLHAGSAPCWKPGAPWSTRPVRFARRSTRSIGRPRPSSCPSGARPFWPTSGIRTPGSLLSNERGVSRTPRSRRASACAPGKCSTSWAADGLRRVRGRRTSCWPASRISAVGSRS